MLDMCRRVQALMPGAIMTTEHLLPTTVVGSYPQPDWLVDRALLRTMVPRVRVRELWRGEENYFWQARGAATLLPSPRMECAHLHTISHRGVSAPKYFYHLSPPLAGLHNA